MTEAELEAEAERLEDEAATKADAGLASATAALIVAFTALWAVHGIAQLRPRLVAMLDGLPGPADPENLRGVLVAATLLGATVADPAPTGRPRVPLDHGVWAEAAATPGKVRQLLDQARLLAANVDTYDDLVRVAAVAREAGRVARRTARNLVNRAIAAGTTFVCDRLDLSRRWIAEGDACPDCRAYHRLVAAPGQPFPTGLTEAAKPIDRRAVPNPPRHPNCRCRVWPVLSQNAPEEPLMNGESSG